MFEAVNEILISYSYWVEKVKIISIKFSMFDWESLVIKSFTIDFKILKPDAKRGLFLESAILERMEIISSHPHEWT